MQEEKKHLVKKIGKCPDCLKIKISFVTKYEFYDDEKEWLQTTDLRESICENCFNEKYLPEIWRRYYDD